MSYQLFHGDCVEVMDKMPGQSAHLVVTDPPFNIDYEYDEYEDSKTEDEYEDFTYAWMTQAYRVLTIEGTLWVCMGDKMVSNVVQMARAAQFCMRSWCIWHYKFGTYTPTKFSRDHAHLLYFVKNPAQHTWNGDDILVPSERQMKYKDKRANPKGRVPGSVWEIPRVAGTHPERVGWHPAQMPIAIMDRMIRATSNEGDTVLDPFAGSGTTLVAALRAGRTALGIETSRTYCQKITERLSKEPSNDPA